MKINKILTTGAFVGALWAGSAAQTIAQTWAPPAEIAPKQAPQAQAAPTPTIAAEQKPAAPAAAAPKTAATKKDKAKECKAQADAKGLHGKERKKFREECVKS